MINKPVRNKARQKRHYRIRNRITGTAQCPRLNVFRSANHIYAQIVDDLAGETLVSASSMDKDFDGYGGNVDAATKVGKKLAENAKEKDITKVVFDRGGYLYHGRVKALADAAREGGLEF